MKTRQNNADELQKLTDRFVKDKQTILALYSCDDDTAGYTATGEIYKLSSGITQILEKGFRIDSSKEEQAIAFTIIEGIKELMQLNNGASEIFSKIFQNFDGVDEFYVTSEKCVSCDSYIRCLKKELKKVGVKIEVKEDNREIDDDETEEPIAN